MTLQKLCWTGALAYAIACPAQGSEADHYRNEILLLQPVEIDGVRRNVFVIDFAMKARTGVDDCDVHYHRGHEFAYILEGSGTIRFADGDAIDFRPGDTLYVPAGKVHWDQNLSENTPVRAIIFLIQPPGAPLSSLKKEPSVGACQ